MWPTSLQNPDFFSHKITLHKINQKIEPYFERNP
jgi:hypothetical protein